MQTTPLAISNTTVSPHVSDVMALYFGLIMNVRIGPMLLSKTKDPTEDGVVNSVVSAIRHPMYIICGLIVEICSMKLSKHLLILVILESHDV
jgi:hypothetical protein